MKTLKQCGVPIGARIIFRLQWMPFLILAILLVLSSPILFLWGMIHESGHEFVVGAVDVITRKLEELKKHRQRLETLYQQGSKP